MLTFTRTQVLSCILLLTAIVANSVSLPRSPRARVDVALSQPLTIRWRYESNFTLNLTPAFDSERIYLPLASGTIVALRARRWTTLLAFGNGR